MAEGKKPKCDETAPAEERVETWEPEFDETYNTGDQEAPIRPEGREGDDHGT